jgi:ribonuclease Z
MNLTFLGTSAGMPTKARNVTALALQEERGRAWYLVDCGEATQHQILRTKLSLNRLAAIFITHVHGDHCYGLPGLLASAAMSGRVEPLNIVAPKGIEEWIKGTILHTTLYLPFELQFFATESLSEFGTGNVVVDAITLSHRVPSYAYCFTEINLESRLNQEKLIADGIPRGPLWGEIKKGIDVQFEGKHLCSEDYLIFDNKPRKIVVGGDNDKPELLAEACHDCHVLVHEATYTADVAAKSGESFGHSSAEQIALFAESVSIPNLVLTHFSARYQNNPALSPSIEDIHKEAATFYSGNLFLAKDFHEYALKKSGDLCLATHPSPTPGRR